jgi:hypothetical protein
MKILLPSSGSKGESSEQRVACHLLVTCLDYSFDIEDGGSTFLCNIAKSLPDYTA